MLTNLVHAMQFIATASLEEIDAEITETAIRLSLLKRARVVRDWFDKEPLAVATSDTDERPSALPPNPVAEPERQPRIVPKPLNEGPPGGIPQDDWVPPQATERPAKAVETTMSESVALTRIGAFIDANGPAGIKRIVTDTGVPLELADRLLRKNFVCRRHLYSRH